MTPLCPPTTGTTTSLASERSPRISDTNVDARTTSSVVTPKILCLKIKNATKSPNPIILAPLGIIRAVFLEHLGNDGDSRVDRIGNDKDKGLGSKRCDPGR